jgi:hypothetical protein
MEETITVSKSHYEALLKSTGDNEALIAALTQERDVLQAIVDENKRKMDHFKEWLKT